MLTSVDRSTDTLWELEDQECVTLDSAMVEALGRLGCGAIIVDSSFNVLRINAIGKRLLGAIMGLDQPSPDDVKWIGRGARHLLSKLNEHLSKDRERWITIPSEHKQPIAAYRIPLLAPNDASARFILIVKDLNENLQPNRNALREVFKLTNAELNLAIRIACGETPARIARHTRVSLTTIRSQLASVFAKTQTRRQAELALLLTRVAIL